MSELIIAHITSHDSITKLGYDRDGGPCFAMPPRPYFIRLPSGMRHHYRTEADARRSNYWPGSARDDLARTSDTT